MFYNVCQWHLALVPRYTIGVWPRDTRCSFLHRINKPCWLIKDLKAKTPLCNTLCTNLKTQIWWWWLCHVFCLLTSVGRFLWFSLILFKELKVLGIWEKIRIKKWPVPGIKKTRIEELVSWSRYLKNIRIKEQPVLGISTPSKNCQGDPAGNAGRLRSLQLCALSLELKAQTLIRCTLMVNHKQQTCRIQESSPIFLIFVLSTIQWFVKTAHCIMGNASFSNNGLAPPIPSYSALPQIPLPLYPQYGADEVSGDTVMKYLS